MMVRAGETRRDATGARCDGEMEIDMDTRQILSDAQIDELDAEQIDDLVSRLGRARAALRVDEIGPLLAAMLEREGIRDADYVGMGVWEWDNGYFPYFGGAGVRLKNGKTVDIEIDDDGEDQRLAELITAEACDYGLGEYSRIRVDVPSGSVSVD